MTNRVDAVSETASGRIGRPSVIPPELERAIEMACNPEAKSRRSLVNTWYRNVAMSRMIDVPGMDWLFDPTRSERGEDAWQPTILTELGRIEDDTEFFRLARLLCERKPKVKDAVVWIRAARSGSRPKGNAEKLAEMLYRIVDEYERHHEVTSEVLLAALDDVRGAIEAQGRAG